MAGPATITTVQTGSINVGGVPGTPANATVDAFIPEIWRDEVLVSREKNFAAASFFKRVNHKGKVGDTIHFPLFSHLTADDKTAGVPFTPKALDVGKVSLTITQAKIIGIMIEDVAKVQSMVDLRSNVTREIGYGLSLALDSDIWALFDANLPAAYKVIGSDGSTPYASAGAGNFANITDQGLRRVIQTLRTNNVPLDECRLFIPPSQENAMLGIDKFTLYQHIGSTDPIRRRRFGTIYGVEVEVNNNLPTITADDTTTTGRLAVLAHKDCVVSAIQIDVNMENSRDHYHKADVISGMMTYGVKNLRLATNDTAASGNRLCEAVGIYVPA